MAREYSPYALNIYIGCSHRCKYCYAPHTLQRTEDSYFGKPQPRKDILKLLEKDLQKNTYKEQVLISFVGDVYCDNADNSETTREVLKLLNAYNVPVAVLSKGGSKMLRDFFCILLISLVYAIITLHNPSICRKYISFSISK